MTEAYRRHDITDQAWALLDRTYSDTKVHGVVSPEITGSLSTPCFGFCVPAHHGAIYHQRTETGRIHNGTSADGAALRRVTRRTWRPSLSLYRLNVSPCDLQSRDDTI